MQLKKKSLSVDCNNRVRPDLPNKQEEIHMQFTAVEGMFYSRHNTSGSILYSKQNSSIILAIDNFFLEKASRD